MRNKKSPFKGKDWGNPRSPYNPPPPSLKLRGGAKNVAALLFFLIGVFFFLQPQAYAEEPVPIKEIEVRGLYSIKKKELIYLLCLNGRTELDRKALQVGIQRAFRKGIFEYIGVEKDDTREGLIRITVVEKDVIKDISFTGNENVSPRALRGHLPFAKGGFMRYDLIAEAREGMKAAMDQFGYPQASVELETSKKGPYGVRILVKIKEGPPVVVKRVEIIGPPAAEVLPQLGIRPGDVFDQFAFRRELNELRNHYKRENYYAPIVGPYTFSDGVLYLNLEPGKRFEADFKGNKAISDKKLRRTLPFLEAEDVRDDLINEAVERMKGLYFEKGHPFVQIAPVISEPDNIYKIVFYINEGKKVEVAGTEFTGTSIEAKRLREIISSKAGKPYNPDLLGADTESLKGFFESLGYLDVSIKTKTDLEEKGMKITYEITEGPQYRLSEVTLEDVKDIPLEEARKAVGVKPGTIYNEVDILDSRHKLMELYNSLGYSDAAVEIRREFEPPRAKVSFIVTEGEKLFFGKHVIIGNKQTKRVVIDRELKHKEGSPFNLRTLLQERQRLYELGIFSEVDTEELDRHDSEVDVAYKVKEAKPGSVELGLGYGDFEGFRGMVGLTYRNLMGMNRTGSARFEYSSIEKRVIFNYLEPYLLGSKYPFRAFLLWENRKERNIDTGETSYKLKRWTASAGVEKKFSKEALGELYYEFSLVDTFDVKPGVVLSREDVGTLAISGVRPAITYDSRDNPFNPRRGYLAGAVMKFASGAFLSETNFVKVTLQASHYIPLSSRFVLALSAKFGAAKGFAGTDELPIVERFFLGGRNTVRGYAQDTLGPKAPDGTPIGGNAFLLGNFEIRASLTKNWGLVAFLDTGNVYPKADDISLTDLKYAVGPGIRYNTPVGPLRVDYGWKLNREADESRGELHFSIGHAF
jgi:outer membrane protein insertion porin family